MHKTAVADGSQQKRDSEIETEDASAQIALGDGYGVTRAQGDIFEYAAVLAQRDFALGAAVEIVEDNFGEAATRQRPEVMDADDAGSGNVGH